MERTIKNFLKTALLPIGSALYIYGGGWNEEDKWAGEEARSIGLSPKWKKFYSENARKGYNFRDFDYKNNPELIHMGLDCSGYVGWALYNLFNEERGKEGFVYKSTKAAESLACKGLGSLTKSENIMDYRAGDILGGEKREHIFICIGSCSDGSLVILHSSPPAPMISGTFTPKGEKSEAIALAEEYMKKAYTEHFEMFPDVSRPESYLTGFNLFRFFENVVSDPEGYGKLPPKDILADLL
ncbi:MAG: hypothetical protein LIO44_01530 [Eubacterium sp.]|nr:hypothetical protein [Eubacterium sp.]